MWWGQLPLCLQIVFVGDFCFEVPHTVNIQDSLLFCFHTAELQVIYPKLSCPHFFHLMGVGDWFIQNFNDVQLTSKTKKENHGG